METGMFSKLRKHAFRFKLAAIAFAIFTAFAAATSVYAQVMSFGPCVSNSPQLEGETSVVLSTLYAQTRQYNSGCEHVTVTLRRWINGSYVYQYSLGVGYTEMVSLPDQAGASNTSRNKGILSGGVQAIYIHTSSNGWYSTANWYCSGSASGSGNCS